MNARNCHSTSRFIGLLRMAMTVPLLAACAATTSPPPFSGFLGSYEEFVADPADSSLLWWEQEGFSWSDYHGVLLDPVIIYYHPEAQNREILPDELKKLTDALRAAVIEELGGDVVVVDEPAPGILQVRCAITDVMPSRPSVNIFTSLVAFVAVDVGGASIEVEFLDAVSGERLAAGVDRKIGGALDGLSNFTRLGQAKQAFRDWAAELRVAFETDP